MSGNGAATEAPIPEVNDAARAEPPNEGFHHMSKLMSAAALAVCLVASACNSGLSPEKNPTLARPSPKTAKVSQGLSTGYSGTATFDVPVVNPNTWQGTPMGTGSWSTTATPPLSGGPQGVGFYDTTSSPAMHYLMLGNFGGASGTFFGILSDGPLALGTSTINNTTLYAGVFDMQTGDPVALASAGTLTLTAAGLIGGKVTGTFSGTLDDVVVTGCTSSAQCNPGDQCINGTCIRTGCTSNAQCAMGQTCQGGQCVAPPQCTSNAQCGAGQVCQNGTCVTGPGCVTDAQCGAGHQCQAGQCVPVAVGNCSGQQGSGQYSGKVATAVCSAFSGGAQVGNAFAAIDDDGKGGRALVVTDPARSSAGVVLPLNACPSGAGTVTVTGAVFWDETVAGGVTYVAAHPATATVSFLKTGARHAGDFHLTLPGGGTVKGSFDVQ